MKITVAGLGRVGLPTAAILAESGHDVVGYDVDKRLLAELSSGRVATAEQPVRDLVRRALGSGRLHPSPMPFPADAFLICVPTLTVGDAIDLRALEHAFMTIAPLVQDGNIVILESTVPPGTTLALAERAFSALGRDLDAIHLAYCPERHLPGNVVDELVWNDRIVGGRRRIDAETARAIYVSFARGDVVLTDLTTAETVKLAENAYRDVNIAFANELAALAQSLGIDIWQTIALANRHPRVNILLPGPGLGGAVPVAARLLASASSSSSRLMETARRVNDAAPIHVAETVKRIAPHARKVLILGAAYKADADDARSGPALIIEKLLAQGGYDVAVYDPVVARYEGNLVRDLEGAARDADVLLLVTDHATIRAIDPAQIAELVRSRCIIDTRNALDVEAWQSAGFDVHVLGRGDLVAREALPS